MQDRTQLEFGQGFFLRRLPIDDSVPDQSRRLQFEDGVKLGRTKEDSCQQPVNGKQRERTDHTARDGVVVTNHRVLHRVRQAQQNNEVEWIELRQLTLSEQAQKSNQEEIHQNRTKNL